MVTGRRAAGAGCAAAMEDQPQPQNAMPEAAAPRKNCRRVFNPSVCCMEFPDDRNEKAT
jgi:hypothetical protein